MQAQEPEATKEPTNVDLTEIPSTWLPPKKCNFKNYGLS